MSRFLFLFLFFFLHVHYIPFSSFLVVDRGMSQPIDTSSFQYTIGFPMSVLMCRKQAIHDRFLYIRMYHVMLMSCPRHGLIRATKCGCNLANAMLLSAKGKLWYTLH